MKKIAFILVLLSGCFVFGQNIKKRDSLLKIVNNKNDIDKKVTAYLQLMKFSTKNDSVEFFANKALKMELSDVNKLKVLYELAKLSRVSYYNDKALKYSKKVTELAKKTNQLSYLAKNYLNIGIVYSNKANYNKAIGFQLKALTIFNQLKDSIQLPNLYSNLGFNYSMIYKDSLALKSYKKGIKIAKKNNDISSLSLAYNNLGSLYFYMGDFNKAILKFDKAIEISKKLNSDHIINSAYGFLANLYYEQGTFDKAVIYATKSIELAEKRNDKFSEQLYLLHLGKIYNVMDDTKSSLVNYYKALNFDKEFSNSKRKAMIYNSLAESYLKLKKIDSAENYINKSSQIAIKNQYKGSLFENLKLQADIASYKNDFNNAIQLYKKALAKFNEDAELRYKFDILLSLGKCYTKTDDYIKANNYFNKAKSLKVKYINPNKKIALFSALKNNSEKLKNYSKATLFANNVIKLKDSLYKTKTTQLALELKEKYQTQQKENKILQLNNQNLTKDIEIKKQNNLIIGVLSLFTISLSAFFFIWYKRKQKHKQLLLKTAIEASEQEKIAIGKDLHDGVASSIIKLVHQIEDTNIDVSHQLLKTYHQVRNLSHQLNNTPLHNELLLERLIEIIPDERNNQIFELQIKPSSLKLNEPIGTHIYRVIQELITNNLKYAKASKTKLSISLKNKTLMLSYKDNGIGIAKLQKKTGLKNIEDRVHLLNGKINWNFKLNNGFAVEIQIPYEG